jgi:hypothetical protein
MIDMIMRAVAVCNRILGGKVEVTGSETVEQNRKVQHREIVVKEELAIHEEEGEVMQAVPDEDETAEGMVLDYLGYSMPESE